MNPNVQGRLADRFHAERLQHLTDPFYAVRQGYVLTEDEKRAGETAPMPATLYMEIVTRLWQLYSIGMLAKSRQLMASWLFSWLHLWEILTSPGALSILQGKRLDDIKAIGTKSLMGRVMFMYRNLPDFLRVDAEIDSTEQSEGGRTLTSLVVPGGGVLIAAPQGPDIIRSKSATSVTMDELAFHPDGPAAWNAALPAVNGARPMLEARNPDWLAAWNAKYPAMAHDWTRGRYRSRLWGVTTPNGMDSLVYGMTDWEKWTEWPELTGFQYENGEPVEGLRVHLKEQRFGDTVLPPIACVRLHYTAEYDPTAWDRRRASKAGYDTRSAYERENEISWRVASGMAVFREGEDFDRIHMDDKYVVVPRRATIVSMDTGFQGQAGHFWQETPVIVGKEVWRRSHLFYSFLHKAWTLDEVLRRVKEELLRFGIDWREVRFVTDWNTLNTHAGGAGITDMQIFNAHDIHPTARRVGTNQKNQAIDLARRAMKTWADGIPGVVIARGKETARTIEMLDGGWRYADPVPGKGYIETPHKDGTYDHIGDAFVYRFWALAGEIWGGGRGLLKDLPPEQNLTRDIRQRIMDRRRQPRALPGGVGPQSILGR